MEVEIQYVIDGEENVNVYYGNSISITPDAIVNNKFNYNALISG